MEKPSRPFSKFIGDQLSVWPLAAANFRALKTAQTRTVSVGGLETRLQFNPERIISALAPTDADSLAARPCFICPENRPPEQFHVKFEGRKGRSYNVQVNPYPVFPDHLVLARDTHVPQSIWHCYVDMLDFARRYPDCTIFYNGPASGASAPDHMHFQACPRGLMPLEQAADRALDGPAPGAADFLARLQDAEVYRLHCFARGIFLLRARTVKSLAKLFYRVLDTAPVPAGEKEPRFNLITWAAGGELRSLLIFRTTHRSRHFFLPEDDPDHLTMSPGCADMGGWFIVPRPEDYAKLDARLLEEMVAEVTLSAEAENEIVWRLTRTQRKIDVGIMAAPEIAFEIISDGAGVQHVRWQDGRINYNGSLYDELVFEAQTPDSLFAEASFILYGVTIGIDFHWERRVDQRFAGSLKFIVEGESIRAVNTVGLEDYLLSVISSEMKATAGLELLKAHAIISRSWVLTNHPHTGFDICADDHCQRYQGKTMAVGANVRRAIDETWGQVLCYGGDICDTRYSKCCGGRTERFSTCWEDRDFPYLQPVDDIPEGGGAPFCDTRDPEILRQVLNDYDRESPDFFAWQVRYTRAELSDLVRSRTGIDFGEIRELNPLERGASGRIKTLEITGTKERRVLGKELAIRRALSPSHLKSSNFEARWEGDTLVLDGRGWGHGVGLCQIGAAVMAHEGYTCRQILRHYYPGTEIERR